MPGQSQALFHNRFLLYNCEQLSSRQQVTPQSTEQMSLLSCLDHFKFLRKFEHIMSSAWCPVHKVSLLFHPDVLIHYYKAGNIFSFGQAAKWLSIEFALNIPLIFIFFTWFLNQIIFFWLYFHPDTVKINQSSMWEELHLVVLKHMHSLSVLHQSVCMWSYHAPLSLSQESQPS